MSELNRIETAPVGKRMFDAILEQAYQAGRNARERGAGEYDNPLYWIISEARELRQYWRKGWKSRDVELGGKK